MSPYITETPNPDANTNDGLLKDAFPHIHEDPSTLSDSKDPFTVTTTTGFMPLQTPRVDLPPVFQSLTKLLEDLPAVKLDGSHGLLAAYQVGPKIDAGALQDLSSEIDHLVTTNGKPDLVIITALFRDYSFLASAYLLEPCWERFCRGLQGLGLGRQVLPVCIAGPLYKAAHILDIPPFMSYAASYALYNYRFADPSIGTTAYSNLRLIRAFEHGLDPSSSEAGFVLTHVDMVKHSPGLVQGAVGLLEALRGPDPEEGVKAHLTLLLDTMARIDASMEKMWAHSRPKDYISYRTFIFGVANQSMFPDGVQYELPPSPQHPADRLLRLHPRGESGANDAMIPLLDALLQIPMPDNPLTAHLLDFRRYRPKPHRDFLDAVRRVVAALGVRQFCCPPSVGPDAQHPPAEQSRTRMQISLLYLRLLDAVRAFRWRHWLFAREYILRRTSHPTASGGSPVVTWLPNQLGAVMDLMLEVWEGMGGGGGGGGGERAQEETMMEEVREQREKLRREVDRWCAEREV